MDKYGQLHYAFLILLLTIYQFNWKIIQQGEKILFRSFKCLERVQNFSILVKASEGFGAKSRIVIYSRANFCALFSKLKR